RLISLQERAIRVELDGEQVRRVEDARLLAEALADALLLGEGIGHRGFTSERNKRASQPETQGPRRSASPAWSWRSAARRSRLLDLHFRAGILELLLDGVGVGLGDRLLDGRGHALDEVLRLLQAETGDLADHLDHGDFLVGRVLLEEDGELRLLLGRGRGGGAR